MRLACLAVMAAVSASCVKAEAVKQPVDVEMRNVDLHLTTDIEVHVRHLRGQFIAQGGAREIPYLDDPRSYTVAVRSGEVAVDLESLNAMMTRALQGHSNVRRLEISVDDDGRLRQKGVVTKGISVPFDVKARISLAPDGRIRVHAESVKGFGLPVNPLLKTFRISMDDLLTVEPGRGVAVEANDLLLDPAHLLPPPAMTGSITSVRIDRGMLVQTFGTGTAQPLAPRPTSKNYIYWRGGQLTFGKLTMTETDLELVDDDPKDPFDFSVDRWNRQLVAGYSKVTPSRGLKAHLKDFNDLARR